MSERIGSEADDEASYAYRREGRAEERAAIVAWLRERIAPYANYFANAIERGEHEEARLAAGGKYKRSVVWVKPDSAPQFTGDRPAQAFEMIALGWAGTGRSEWNGGGKRGVYTAMVNNFGRLTDGRPHPTQKPLGLMEALIRDFTDPNDLVCDPFAGSGTTGVAALRLGRRFVGWERDPRYHAVATKRLSRAREQLQMFEGVADVAAPPTASPPAPTPAGHAKYVRGGSGQGALTRRVRVELDGVEVET